MFTPESHLGAAVSLANELDELIEQGFVTIKTSKPQEEGAQRDSPSSIGDARISTLIELLASRSRTSEAPPSLQYVRDLEGSLSSVMALVVISSSGAAELRSQVGCAIYRALYIKHTVLVP